MGQFYYINASIYSSGLFHMILQDIDCIVDNEKKTDLVKPRELPNIPLGKDFSMEGSSSTVKIVVSHLFIFI